jgi:hypothetical protein
MSEREIPRDADELVTMYGTLVTRRVTQMVNTARIPWGEFPDVLQAVWLRVLEGGVVEKFWARTQATRPDSLTTEEVCLHLGISVDSWLDAQEEYVAGGGTIPWMPTPVEGDPVSMGALWAVDDVERYEAMVYEHHEQVAPRDRHIPVSTGANFRTYLMRAVQNAFYNLRRSERRHHQDRPIDFFLRPPEDKTLEDMFDLAQDTAEPVRRMENGVTARETVTRYLGDSGPDFVALLAEGYSAREAVQKMRLTKRSRERVRQCLKVF